MSPALHFCSCEVDAFGCLLRCPKVVWRCRESSSFQFSLVMYYTLFLKACCPVHRVVFWVLPISSAGTFESLAWISVVSFHNGWYLWLVLRHILVVMVSAAVIAVVYDP
jgi:hypothetical protein